MSLWSRLFNVCRGDRLLRDIDEEFQLHIEEAVRRGSDQREAQQAFGSSLRHREASRDIKLIGWLDSLRADTIFGWRQLYKNKVTSAVSILSLALGLGACLSAFRLIDALLLRPLPVSEPQQLYALVRQGIGPDGKFRISESNEYPLFQLMRSAVKGEAELIAISYADRMDVTFGSDGEIEKPYVQYVSGWMFRSFGLRAAIGRMLTDDDDQKPGAHPYAVLSYDYWTHRFGADPKVIGRKFQMSNDVYEIVGVAQSPFTGTEPGIVTNIFVPTMMHAGVTHADWSWFRTMARVKPGVEIQPLRAKLDAIFRAFQQERAKGFVGWPKERLERFLETKLDLQPAAAGLSNLQTDYRLSLGVLSLLAALVLLIACVNLANLMTAQTSVRAREMALRVSIGAGRWRLIQLVLMQSVLLGFQSALLGGAFAWWSAPFVVSLINPPDNPARLLLPADWRALGFGVGLTTVVSLIFGLAPALRASSIQPAAALKGGDYPHGKRNVMYGLVLVQIAFGFLVLFIAGLLVTTFNRLSRQPTGFSAKGLLVAEVTTQRLQAPAYWDRVADHLRTLPGVENVAIARFALLSGNGMNGFVTVNGEPKSGVLGYFLNVSPGWLEVMRIPLLDGRDFRNDDTSPGVAIVNLAFAKAYFGGQDPLGKTFEKAGAGRYKVIGLVGDARYRNMREPITPTAYIPFHSVDASGTPRPENKNTFIVRVVGAKLLAFAPVLRREIPESQSGFRVSNIRTQEELNQSHTVRERLLATLGVFFAGVSLILAGLGTYGVLHYSVLQQRREIGIRMAIGAPPHQVMRHVTSDAFSVVLAGAFVGLVSGLLLARYIQSLLYGVHARDAVMLAIPAFIIVAVALIAATPAVINAIRIDPVETLRTE